MKKYIIVSISACLFFIGLSGYYIHSGYVARIDAKKELLMSYAHDVKNRTSEIVSRGRELALIVKPIAGEKGLLNNNPETYAENILLLENFYTVNNYFTKGISIYDRYGNVFNIYRDKDGSFIKDSFKSRVINVLRSEESMVTDKNSFFYVLPVYYGDTLAGNVSLNLDMTSLLEELFRPYAEKRDIYPSSVLGEKSYVTFPIEDGLILSHETDISEEITERNKGFMFGKINGYESSEPVLSYYEDLPISGYLFGIVFSCNISSIITSSVLSFIVICVLLITTSIVSIVRFQHAFNRNRDRNKEKDRLIEFMQTIYRDAPVGIMVSRLNRFIAANKYAFSLMEGFISESDLGKPMDKVNFPHGFFDDSANEEFRNWSLRTFEVNGQEKFLGRKQMTIEIAGAKYTIDGFWDITDLEHSRRDAIRSEIAKSELLSRISIDFKKPLGNIEDAVVLLMQKYPDEPNITHIDNSADNLSTLIDDVQDFADIEAGRVVLDEIPFNIVEELKRITDAYAYEVQKKGINLHTEIAPSACRSIVGDPQRFGQILDHLLSNAVKFTDRGEVRISVETTDLQDGKVMLKCFVEDTGPGISKQKLKNLFSIDLRAKEENESLGLGVIIVKKLITIMGGTIRATSPSPIATHPDAPGTQFSFTIQCYSDRQSNKKFDFSSVTSRKEINVLLISSEAHQIQYLSNYLSRKEIRTDIFIYNKDSAELLINKLIIDKNRYQIAIIEATDSETSFAIIRQIHTKDLTKQCLYVFIDPYHQKGNYLKSKALGIDYYFVKSEDLSNFDLILKDWFVNLADDNTSASETLRKDIRILVAEDNALSRTVANVVFKQLGYEIDFARNSSDLEDRVSHNTYDIIFIDLKFPPSDGFEVAETLRQKEYKLPIIAMTSTQTKDNLRNISDSGMDGYVSKPLNSENIKNTLLQWFV